MICVSRTVIKITISWLFEKYVIAFLRRLFEFAAVSTAIVTMDPNPKKTELRANRIQMKLEVPESFLTTVSTTKLLHNITSLSEIKPCTAEASLLRSRFLGCHAMLHPKKRLLTTEPHSFPFVFVVVCGLFALC